MQPKLLLVNDDEDILLTFAALFRRDGFAVTTASSGLVALDLLAASPVDLVLSDVRMPVIDGIELVERVVAEYRPGPPLLLMSGFHDPSEAEALDRGAVRVLTKPLEAKIVAPAMRRLLLPARERWSAPPAVVPAETIELRVESLAAAQAAGDVAFGRGGAFLHVGDPVLEVGTEVQLKIEAQKGESFAAIAKVVWARRRDNPYFHLGYGLEFLAASGPSLELIANCASQPDLKAFVPIGGTPAYLKRL